MGTASPFFIGDVMREDVAKAAELIDEIGGLLWGYGPDMQGAILADLLAMWLAGHLVPGDKAATKKAREALLQEHIKCVRELIPENEKEILARMETEGSA